MQKILHDIDEITQKDIDQLDEKGRIELVARVSKFLLLVQPDVQKKMCEYIDAYESKDLDLSINKDGQGYINFLLYSYSYLIVMMLLVQMVRDTNRRVRIVTKEKGSMLLGTIQREKKVRLMKIIEI